MKKNKAPNRKRQRQLRVQRVVMPRFTDKELLDWLDSKTDGSSWVARQSTTGRGFRLHNTGRDDSHWPIARGTARGAIEAAMLHEREA